MNSCFLAEFVILFAVVVFFGKNVKCKMIDDNFYDDDDYDKIKSMGSFNIFFVWTKSI